MAYRVLDVLDYRPPWQTFRAVHVRPDGAEEPAILRRASEGYGGELARMLVDEARVARFLLHPNLVRLIDSGTDGELPWLLYDHYEGRTLAEVQATLARREDPFPMEVAVWVVSSVLRGLESAHGATGPKGEMLGIVHREVIPANVELGWSGTVRLGGYTISKSFLHTDDTPLGTIKGHFAYLSPEQVRGAPLDGRSDVFAAGILLYELLTQRSPFVRKTDLETIQAVRAIDFTPIHEIAPRVPDALVEIAGQALAPVDDRWPSAEHFADALDEWLATAPAPAGPRSVTRLLRLLYDPEALGR